ncbi:hypothetical protein [Vibrio harveyi]|uniref:hypothetical protein n=1 Tax=Vibrio harveyi TaxID=669 RepID=UPI003CFACB8C
MAMKTVKIPLYAMITVDVEADSDEEAIDKAMADCLNIGVDLSEMEEDHDEHIELLPYRAIAQGFTSHVPLTKVEVVDAEE